MSEQKRIAAALSLDGLAGDARAGFDLAAAAGYGGVAVPTNHPELKPAALGASGRRHLRKELERRGLAAQVIRVAGPRAGLTDAAEIGRTMDNARVAIQLAYDLGAKTVAVNAGPLGGVEGTNGRMSEGEILDAARQLAAEADRAGIVLAFSADSDEKLVALLREVGSSAARANVEPARAVAAGADPVSMVEWFAGLMGELTLADAIRAGRQGARVVEMGTGQVPWSAVWAMLREQGFQGPMVVDVRDLAEGDAGARRAAEVIRAMADG